MKIEKMKIEKMKEIFEGQGCRLWERGEAIESQKKWNEGDELKKFDFSSSFFWLTAPGIEPVPFDDIDEGVEFMTSQEWLEETGKFPKHLIEEIMGVAEEQDFFARHIPSYNCDILVDGDGEVSHWNHFGNISAHWKPLQNIQRRAPEKLHESIE